MPIHDIAWWAPSPEDVILFIEDQCTKQLVGFVCLVKELDDALAPTNAKKGFEVDKIKDLNAKVVLKKWIKFKEFIELESEDTKEIPEVVNTL